MENPKACPKCGVSSAPSCYYCPVCGASLDEIKPSSDQDVVNAVGRHPKKRPGCITVYVVLLVFSCLGSYWTLPAILQILNDPASIYEPSGPLTLAVAVLGLDSLLGLLPAWGLWHLKNWARIWVIVELSLMILIGSLLHPAAGIVLLLLFSYVIYWMIWHDEYFTSARTDEQRKAARVRWLGVEALLLLVVVIIGVVGLSRLSRPDRRFYPSSCFQTLTAHEDKLNRLVLSPDGEALAVQGYRHCDWRLWQLEESKLSHTLEGDCAVAAFTPDSDTFALADSGAVRFYQSGSGALLDTWRTEKPGGTALAFSPDGTLLAASLDNDTIDVWQVDDQMLSQTIAHHRRSGWPTSVAFSPDNTLLASGTEQGPVYLWRASDTMLVGTLLGHKSSVQGLAFSSDGALLASSAEEGAVCLWDVDTGELLHTYTLHRERIHSSVAFTSDGLIAAFALEGDNEVCLWKPQE